ncbi:serine/threonine-protein kinase STY13-like isoform X2 [Tasmannia lanceolata]|uniref:serine/threonine-protein kinase STY13-like isoform X2 n=1 Tax=Tasmannia lanceolata TaxID=3420 RepID=UPI0040635E39
MESGNGFYSTDEFQLDPKWLIDPKLLFVGPRIGEGAHAKVYEGKYKNQDVAVKIVHRGDTPEEVAKREGRFEREVAMLSRVQHKNLVKFIGACKEPVMVVVTELLLGGSLRKYMLNIRPRCLDMSVAVGFALDIARAMECLHSHGIIHRDLKPENLLLTADQKTVKLVDFGLAREETLTEMMTAETGTYRWMAPELYSTVTLRHGEKKHYNHKVDAYSFAIVLWELLHNRLPFEECQTQCRKPPRRFGFNFNFMLEGRSEFQTQFQSDSADAPRLFICPFTPRAHDPFTCICV